MAKNAKSRRSKGEDLVSVTEIQVGGFKSLRDDTKIEIRPLTILAGVNSSGKSSMMQPLLLLKQTLEASYDPGCLLLNGPNVNFTSANQLLSRTGKGHPTDGFHVGMRLNKGHYFETIFRKADTLGFQIEQMKIGRLEWEKTFWPNMSNADIENTGGADRWKPPAPEDLPENLKHAKLWHLGIAQRRCFLELQWQLPHFSPVLGDSIISVSPSRNLADLWQEVIPQSIHLPGWRGNPERAYPATAVGPAYPGTFDKYTASVISHWLSADKELITRLEEHLTRLQLASGIKTARTNDAQIEILIGRLPGVSPSRPDLAVNIADVGIGVSQTLPIVVALLVARPGQMVYVEQPETHLHPRAQFALAEVFGSASQRGVQVVVETHSSLFLLGIQELVAKGSLEPEKVKLHWFGRDKYGRTSVTSGDLDEAGRFGDWPEDFDDVSLKAQSKYLDAAEARLAGK